MYLRFQTVLDYTRTLDSTRPVTFVCNEPYNKDLATPYVDVVSLNLYEGWYSDKGHTEVIKGRVENYFNHWHQVSDHYNMGEAAMLSIDFSIDTPHKTHHSHGMGSRSRGGFSH